MQMEGRVDRLDAFARRKTDYYEKIAEGDEQVLAVMRQGLDSL